MPYMDKGLEMPHVIEERRLNFEQFVQEQQAKGNPGMTNAALHCIGHRDSYGPVVFEPGITRRGQWVLPMSKNGKVVVYMNRDEADKYAKSLLPILKLYGYIYSKIWVEKVSVHITMPNPHSPLIAPGDIYEDDNRFIIRMKVQ